MKSTCWMRATFCGLAPLILAGCMAPGPYNYGTYPGYYAPPPQGFVAPQGMPVSPGSYPPSTLGAPVNPGGSAPPTWSPPPTSSPTPAGPPQGTWNNGAKPFGSPSIESKRIENRVPEPLDEPLPRGSGLPGPAPGAGAGTGPAPSPQNKSPFGAGDNAEPTFKEDPKESTQIPVPQQRRGAPPESFAAAGGDSFETPLDRTGQAPAGAVIATSAKAIARKSGAESTQPYDYDRSQYSWLRGMVDFDPRDKSWHIIYCTKPDDQFGGALGIVDHPKLSSLKNGDFVYLTGHINPNRRDARGKVLYEIDGDTVVRVEYRNSNTAVGN